MKRHTRVLKPSFDLSARNREALLRAAAIYLGTQPPEAPPRSAPVEDRQEHIDTCNKLLEDWVLGLVESSFDAAAAAAEDLERQEEIRRLCEEWEATVEGEDVLRRRKEALRKQLEELETAPEPGFFGSPETEKEPT